MGRLPHARLEHLAHPPVEAERDDAPGLLTPILLLAGTAAPYEPSAVTPFAPVAARPADPTRLVATGTFTQTGITSLDVREVGPLTILNQTSVGTVTGTIDGTFEDRLRVVVHASGWFVATFTLTCTCTVDGHSGRLVLQAADTGRLTSPNEGTFEGIAAIRSGGGQLAGMRGVLRIGGTVNLTTGLSTYDYIGTVRAPW